MKKYVFERHTYAPELNRVYLNGVKIPGKWNGLNSCKSYQECVQFVRKAQRPRRNTNRHYVSITFADSGNLYAAGHFDKYEQLKDVLSRTERTLKIKFL